MIEIRTSSKFRKQYKKLPRKTQLQFLARVKVLSVDEYNYVLKNHALSGKYGGYRSINVTGDVRALYRKQGSTIIIFAFIGSHSQLYG